MRSRIASMVGLGRVTATRDDAPLRVAQVRLSEVETRDQTPMMQQYGLASRPHPAADTLHVCLDGDRSQMVIIATHDQRYTVRLVEGEVCLHDDQGQAVWLKRGGITINSGGLPITINGNVTINGTLFTTGDITDANGAHGTLGSLRSAYDTHTHNNVQNGAGVTGTPSVTV